MKHAVHFTLLAAAIALCAAAACFQLAPGFSSPVTEYLESAGVSHIHDLGLITLAVAVCLMSTSMLGLLRTNKDRLSRQRTNKSRGAQDSAGASPAGKGNRPAIRTAVPAATANTTMPAAKPQPAPVVRSKQLQVSSQERRDGKMVITVDAKYCGYSPGHFHDHVILPKLMPIKLITWLPREDGAKLRLKGTVSKDNLAAALEAINKIK